MKNMRFNYYFYSFLSLLFLTSCIKHEVIPAPEHIVDLSYSFTGVINNEDVKLSSENLNYICIPTQEKNLVSPPQLSSAIYYNEISSSLSLESIKIGLGHLQWDQSTGDSPSLSIFNAFFTNTTNIFPQYKDNCSPGFKVFYTDKNGITYVSKETILEYKDVKFSNNKQDSDATGDYSKFTCTFNCYVYYESGPTPDLGRDSLKIQMGRLKGYFKK
jgi:hypothetical protein